ncbi:MAG: hypothetical protein ACLGI6_22120 [Gammaproteobacteria bacterium]
MNNIGPTLETLTHRLADTPADFLADPGQVSAAALIHDLLRRHGARPARVTLQRFQSADSRDERSRLTLACVIVWLLSYDWFAARSFSEAQLLEALDGTATSLAEGVAAQAYVQDPDRREELARIVLARLDLRPEGETLEQATDRLSGISGTERRRLVEASRAAQQRAREIREALARKAAEEAADKWTRD